MKTDFYSIFGWILLLLKSFRVGLRGTEETEPCTYYTSSVGSQSQRTKTKGETSHTVCQNRPNT